MSEYEQGRDIVQRNNGIDRRKLIAEGRKHLATTDVEIVTPCSAIDCERQEAIDRENEGLVRLECTNCRDSGICMMEGGLYE